MDRYPNFLARTLRYDGESHGFPHQNRTLGAVTFNLDSRLYVAYLYHGGSAKCQLRKPFWCGY